MATDVSDNQAQFIKALGACRAILSRGPSDRSQWQREARTAVQRLYDLVEEALHRYGGVELGLSLPLSAAMDLIGVVNDDLRRAYLWNDVASITALPAPAAWLRTLREFLDTLGTPKRKRPAPPMLPEDELLLTALADAYPASVNQPDLEGLTNLPKRTISNRLCWLESKRLVKRPDGTKRKGHSITPAGLSAVGRLEDCAP